MRFFSMLARVILCVATVAGLALPSENKNAIDDEEDKAQSFLHDYFERASVKCNQATVASWNYNTNINDENEANQLKTSLEYSNFEKAGWQNVTEFFPSWRKYENEDLRRMFKKLTILGSAALPKEDLIKYNQLETDMTKIHSTTRVCSYKDKTVCNLSLDPDIKQIMKDSRNEEELRFIWTEWHDKCGNKVRNLYPQFIELSNKAAKLNNFSDTGAFWLHDYETDSFKEDLDKLYETLRPLYEQIHAFVRTKLRDIYVDQISTDGLIPAHLLGNVFASGMQNIYSLMIPYPERPSVDVSDQMKQQGYTPLKMFQKSEEFFTSLGLLPMPSSFWINSILEKPKDREMACHATAWDFCDKSDFRIRQCTQVATKDFVTVHHEMGHIQYYLQYKDQPIIFRGGANRGFHEAVGDTLALSVQTPKHLKEIGLLDAATPIDDYETSINFLFNQALQNIASLPFAHIMDKYRFALFDGTVPPSNYNAFWWQLRKKYQGIKPPIERTEDNFDPGSLYHIVTHTEYTRYFVASIIQFQFHRALCVEANQYDPLNPSKPLYNCDIYGSKAAGAKLAAGLAMGSSRPWPEVMKAITGQEKMDASAIREYFKPLEDWLVAENFKSGETPGWS